MIKCCVLFYPHQLIGPAGIIPRNFATLSFPALADFDRGPLPLPPQILVLSDMDEN